MGMKLVGLVLTKWAPHVPDRAFRLLMRMAMTARDEPTDTQPADMFFGGRDLLLSVMRSERSGTLKALEKAVERGINDLIQIGAIARMNKPRVGFRAEYRLTLMAPIRIVGHASADQKEGDTQCRAEGDTHVPEGDTQCRAEGDTSGTSRATPTVAPRSNEETRLQELEEQRQEDLVNQRGPVPPTREDEPAEAPIDSTSKCGNESCELGFVYDATKPKGHRNIRCPTCKPDPPNVIPIRGRRSA